MIPAQFAGDRFHPDGDYYWEAEAWWFNGSNNVSTGAQYPHEGGDTVASITERFIRDRQVPWNAFDIHVKLVWAHWNR